MAVFGSDETPQAQWLHLIVEAESQAGYLLSHDIKKYLMLTLDHYTNDLTLPTSIIAIDYLNALNQKGTKQSIGLRNIGDQCLILSGLFPERLLKKNVSLDYTISIGRQSYSHLAIDRHCHPWDSDLFQELHVHFMGLVDILHFMRAPQ